MNRDEFEILKSGIIYLDSSATNLKPNRVINKINEVYTNYSANIHSKDYDIAYKSADEFDNTRKCVAKFINTDKDHIIFTSGTTMGINLVARSLSFNDNDEILITYLEHASNVLPWFNTNAKVKYIPLDENYKLTLDNVKKSITNNTKLVCFAHVTNSLGDERDVYEICNYLHGQNILTLVDGAQAISHTKVDVAKMNCDFYAFSAHKAYGPFGVGVLYAKDLNMLKPLLLGGGMNESFDSQDEVVYRSGYDAFEGGTPNVGGVIAFSESIKFMEDIGIDNIKKYEIELKDYLVNGLKNINHIKLYNNPDVGVVIFNVDGIFSQDVAQYLNKYKVCVRAGNHCAKLVKKVINDTSTVRISLGVYNTKEEIDIVLNLLSDKDKIIREML